MRLSETEIVWGADVIRVDLGDGPEIRVFTEYADGVAFDRQTAAEFLPILEHFVKTGELPE